MTGRPPTPTAKLKLAGSRRAKARKNEPTPDVALPDPPEYLTDIALAIYADTGAQLVAQGVMTSVDREVLGEWAQCAADVRMLREVIDKDGMWYEGQNGLRKHPAVTCLRETYDRMRHAGVRLGLSPVDRVRVKVSKPVKDTGDNKQRFFKKSG